MLQNGVVELRFSSYMVHETLAAGCSRHAESETADSWPTDQKQALAGKERLRAGLLMHRTRDREGDISEKGEKIFAHLKAVNR